MYRRLTIRGCRLGVIATLVLCTAAVVQADDPKLLMQRKRPPLPPQNLPPLPPQNLPPLPPQNLPPPPPSPQRPDRKLPELPKRETKRGYKFGLGQTFAYRVEISIDQGESLDRYVGTPYFLVHDVDDKGAAEIETVGRLVHETKGRNEPAYHDTGDDGIWVATRICLDAWGSQSYGRKDANLNKLPALMEKLTTVTRMIFPQVSEYYQGEFIRVRYSEGSATLFTTRTGGLIGPTISTSKGIEKDLATMEPSGGDIAKLVTEHSFHTTEGQHGRWQYTSTGRFDLQRGLLLDCDGQFYYESDGKKESVTTVKVKLLDGEDFRKAQANAVADRAKMPSDIVPIEFRRTKVEKMPFLPVRFKTVKDFSAGQTVAHSNDHDHHWYLADFIEVTDPYKVRIRYRGSNEEFDVHPGTLAPPPGR